MSEQKDQPLESEVVEEANENSPQSLTNGSGSPIAANSIQTARVIGRPFQKGVSGNPSGRPRNPLKQFYLAKFETDEGKEFMRKMWEDAQNGDNKARELVLHYSIGKPEMAPEDREAIAQGGDGSWLLAHFGLKR